MGKVKILKYSTPTISIPPGTISLQKINIVHIIPFSSPPPTSPLTFTSPISLHYLTDVVKRTPKFSATVWGKKSIMSCGFCSEGKLKIGEAVITGE